MTLFVELLILAGVLAAIAFPLYSRRAVDSESAAIENTALADLLFKRDAAFTALSDLEFDHKTGKIDDHDYREMKERFEAEAVAILEEVDAHGATPVAKKEAAKAAPRFCPHCGQKVADTGHKFCASCGTALPV